MRLLSNMSVIMLEKLKEKYTLIEIKMRITRSADCRGRSYEIYELKYYDQITEIIKKCIEEYNRPAPKRPKLKK